MDHRIEGVVDEQPYPMLFVTVSGAHLYGFPSPDSDYDLRGAHILPVAEVVGLDRGRETIEVSRLVDALQIDLVTHDVRKFILLLLKKNGYVLEQLLSPLVVRTTSEHEELKALAPQCITRYHAFHYLGFAKTQWELCLKQQPLRAKTLLYVYRVLLTGIHLMRTGEIEANLPRLNEEYGLPYIPDLIARKTEGREHGALDPGELAFHEQEYVRLRAELEAAHSASTLPAQPRAKAALNDLLVRVRLGTATGGALSKATEARDSPLSS
jgi:predicted nucleotidyltransferase